MFNKISRYIHNNFFKVISTTLSIFLILLLIITSNYYTKLTNCEALLVDKDAEITQLKSNLTLSEAQIDELLASEKSLNKLLNASNANANALSDRVDELTLELGKQEPVILGYQKEIEELIEILANKVTYPDNKNIIATAVWNRLKSWGLNDYVAAGIIGNMMTEVAGTSLDLSRWKLYSYKSTYGLCQWLGPRKERLLTEFGSTVTDQLDFLYVEMYEVIKMGDKFYDMQDEKEAALYFAKVFERCGKGSYNQRQSNATKALEYFTGKGA